MMCRGVECSIYVVAVVRRIQQDQIERVGGRQSSERGNNLRVTNSIAFLDAAVFQVLLDERDRAAVPFDEGDVRGAPAQRLDAYGARSRIAVNNACTVDARRGDGEERFAHLVGRRSQAWPIGAFELAPLIPT